MKTTLQEMIDALPEFPSHLHAHFMGVNTDEFTYEQLRVVVRYMAWRIATNRAEEELNMRTLEMLSSK